MRLTQLARLYLEDSARRFVAFEVTSAADEAACRRLVEAVRRDELRRMAGPGAFDTTAFPEHAGRSHLLAVRDRLSGRVVGCVRGTFAASLQGETAAWQEYRLDRLPLALLERTAIAARMVVHPAWRRSAASLVLTRDLYRLGLRDLGLLLFSVSCEPALLGLYQRMGYRPVGRVWAKPEGGFRVPMLLAGHDEAHLAALRSHLLPVLRATPRPWPTAGVDWLAADLVREPVDVGVAPLDPDDAALAGLTAGLSSAGRRGLLQNAVTIAAQPDDLVFRAGDGVHSLLVVLAGEVEVQAPSPVRLGPGDLVGVVSTLGRQARCASVVVRQPGTRLAQLSRTALDRVRHPRDRALLFERLARVAAERAAEAVHEGAA